MKFSGCRYKRAGETDSSSSLPGGEALILQYYRRKLTPERGGYTTTTTTTTTTTITTTLQEFTPKWGDTSTEETTTEGAHSQEGRLYHYYDRILQETDIIGRSYTRSDYYRDLYILQNYTDDKIIEEYQHTTHDKD